MWQADDHGETWLQRSPFTQQVVPPATEICDEPLYCIAVNQEWLPYLAGAAMVLAQPSTWKVDTDEARTSAVRRATDLVAEIGLSMPCNERPYQPPGVDTAQQACNIAGYLAFVVIREAMSKAVAAVQQDLQVLNFGNIIIRLIPGVGFVYPAFASAIISFLGNIASGNLSDYQDAIGDDVLWGEVTCAIYDCIKTDGDVTVANFPCIKTNLCAISYVHASVVDAICSWVNDLGAQNMMQAQHPGVLASYTCGCDGPPTVAPPTSPLTAIQDSGTGRVLISAGRAVGQLLITFAQAFGTTPVVIPGTADPIMLPSVASVAPGSFLLTAEAARPVDVDTYVDVDWIALPPGSS